MVDKIFNEDCIEGMKRIPDSSVDFVLTDLPFSITACDWDKKINLEKFWQEVKRIIKPQSSTEMNICAKNRPMSKYEEILIFSNGVVNHESLSPKTRMKYFPQGVYDCKPKIKSESGLTVSQITLKINLAAHTEQDLHTSTFILQQRQAILRTFYFSIRFPISAG